MLTKSDLTRAQAMIAERDTAQRIRDRMRTEPVSLMVGDGKEASVIHLSADYLGQMVFEVKASLDDQIKTINAALTEMGVEP
ncbi:hypothetical protein X740_30970 [Mesorhizobium sp. LNHC221B00]|uniref:hypothetical protein n=1 Tax=Mesorhizobium sp. LNHC221B00 TaxID=1287233 RepID=UPI0003CE1251|nr:hypothetical protein [Mesorhizobium sp. LNHC221B00]ESY75530.1 hypothetical protein X740_30970 [Mesorhizobium sp. LNHC221B00]